METRQFGRLPDGTEVTQYVLKTAEAEVRILNFGGIITDYIVRGRNIVCGFDRIEDYLEDTSYQGALIGRFANRIKGAEFTLGGTTYHIGANEGRNSLHGGVCGFNRRMYEVTKASETRLILSRTSPDGEEGYPGNLSLKVTYALDGAALSLHYTATSDADTPLSLTNHAYFNLDGIGGSILDHVITIHADRYTAVDDELIPTGERLPVAGTDYDLRTPKRIGDKEGGFDTNFVLAKIANAAHPLPAATVKCADMALTVYTTCPCIQLYTGCVLEGTPDFRGGVKKAKYTAYCLETQFEPDAPNRGEGILRAGEVYDHTTVFFPEWIG